MKPPSVLKVEQVSKCFYIAPQGPQNLREALQNALQLKFSKKKPFMALERITFKVAKGEVLGIIGANGSGKSTLLKLLSKITTPTSGRIEITGKINTLLEVGTGFHPELTGTENIFLNGSILGMTTTEIRQKFDEIVAFSEVEEFLNTPVKHYSSGMYVRLAFSVAVHLNPDILIIDEVLSVGDSAFQEKCIEKIEQEITRGCTVLFVSHNMDTVEKLCSRVLLLEKGRIIHTGLPGEVISHYLTNMNRSKPSGFSNLLQRAGNGKLRFLDLELFDLQDVPIQQTFAGQDLRFKIKYCSEVSSLSKVNIRLIIRATTSHFNIACISRVQLPFSRELPQEGTLVCTIKKLPLNIGKYTVELEGRHEGLLADLVPEAMQLDVGKGSFYRSGTLPAPNYHMLVDYDWHLE